MSNVFLMVEAVAGADVHRCLSEMGNLAQRFGIAFGCRMNGVLAIVSPGDDVGDVYRIWRDDYDRRDAKPVAEGGGDDQR